MRTSRFISTRAARVSGEIFLFAIVFVVLSEELVELLLDPHQREDDSPEVLAIDLDRPPQNRGRTGETA